MTGYGRDEGIGRHCPFLSAEPAESAEMTRLRQTITTGEGGLVTLALSVALKATKSWYKSLYV